MGIASQARADAPRSFEVRPESLRPRWGGGELKVTLGSPGPGEHRGDEEFAQHLHTALGFVLLWEPGGCWSRGWLLAPEG